MILVTCGSSHLPFDRLIRAVDLIGGDERIVVQHGPSTARPVRSINVDFLPFAELEALVSDARLVITHAGVGSILLALTYNKRPVVIPRRAHLGEVVDDHQLACARRFARADLVSLVEDPNHLPDAVNEVHTLRAATDDESSPLVSELRSFVLAAVAR